MLAETGLLDGCEATSHWGYQDLFNKHYPKVHFRPEPNLVFADTTGRIVTAGGTTSWHDLAIHIIARHSSPGEALRIAKVYLLKWHGEGQLPYATLVRRNPHADSVVKACEQWLAEHYRESGAIQRVVERAKVRLEFESQKPNIQGIIISGGAKMTIINDRIVLMSGSAHRDLAEAISKELDVPLALFCCPLKPATRAFPIQ